MYRFALFLLLFPLQLFSDASSISTESEILESAHTPLTSIYGVPATNVFGVNVINGDYHYSCVDFDLPSSDSLILKRTYSSSRFKCGGFGHGWSHNATGSVMSYSTDYNKFFHAVTSGTLSGELPFKTEMEKKHEPLKINTAILEKGITNCGKGEISGRTNVKNILATYSFEGTHVKNGDGTENFYRKFQTDDDVTRSCLANTKKPNGLELTYNNQGHTLLSVQALTHQKEFSNQIKFTYPSNMTKHVANKKPFEIKGVSDDGKNVTYLLKFHELHPQCPQQNVLISKVESNFFPTEYYSYTDPKPENGPEKLKERYGSQHKIAIDYYKKGDTVSLYGIKPEDVKKSKFVRNRVKQICVAVDGSQDLKPVCRFAYHKNKQTKDAFTDVYTAYNHLTRFHYSAKNYRLNCIENYKGKNKRSIYRRERLEFGAKSTPLEGDLLYKTVEDADGVVHFGENYDYDDRGNILKKKLIFRSYTETKVHPITVKVNHASKGNSRLKGGEVKTTSYTYNTLNLPTSEYDGKLKTIIEYQTLDGKDTNLPKSVLVKHDAKTLKRKFYEFDKNAGCTLRIEDNGSRSTAEDMTSVTCRKIARIVNRNGTFAGLPLEVDTWGSNEKEEKRIFRATYDYDSHGYVEKESYYDSNNKFAYELHKIRDIRGNILSQTDALGQTSHCKYNDYGAVIEVQGPMLESYIQYIYDWQQRPIKEILSCVDGVQLSTSRSYDLEGKLTKIENSYGFSTDFIYNEQGRPVEITYPAVRTETGQWIRPHIRKKYDFLGNLISETDANGFVTIYTRNDAGLPLQISYPDGTYEEFRYSLYGELLEKKEKNESKVVFTYDVFSKAISEKKYDRDGKLLKEISKKYSGDLLVSEIDGEGVKTTYTYDYAGRISELRKGKALTKYVYDSLGRVAEEQHYYGGNDLDYIATQCVYDLLNRVIEKREVDGIGKVHTKTRMTYDAVGHVLSTATMTFNGTATTINTYDPRGNLKTTTDPLGNTTYCHHHYDFMFEGKNLPCMDVIDPSGVRTTTITDAKGSALSTKVYSPTGKLLSNVEYYYDLKGKVVRTENHLPKEVISTQFEYDSASRLIRQVNGAGTPEQITTTFKYNVYAELSDIYYSDDSSKHRAYDGVGRLVEEWSDDKSVHYLYTYNRKDQPVVVEDLNTHKKTFRKYSIEGNLLSEQLENGLKTTYSYDRMNRVLESIYPDGSSVRQTYNPVFLKKAERIKNDKVVYKSEFKEFDPRGKPGKIIFPKNSGTAALEYDLLGRLTALKYPLYQEKQITYDSKGTLVSKIVNKDLQKFKHDHLQQLTLEKTELYSHEYKNDALNRQISIDGQKQSHNAVLQLVNGPDKKYTYDAKGRRTQGSKSRYTYDKFDRLVGVQQGNSTWEFTYDAFNRKMSSVLDGEKVNYIYHGYEEIGSYNTEKKCLDLKVLSAGEGSMPFALELGDCRYSPILSSQRHIVGLVSMEDGNQADYSPLTMFGKDLTETPLSPWRFCGKRHESAQIGIIDFGFRFYHPKSAQWLTQDPLGESVGPNLYAYVKNNPCCFIDRYGLMMNESGTPGQGYIDSCNAAGSAGAGYSGGRSELPEISYYDGFEAEHRDYYDGKSLVKDYWDNSRCYNLGRDPLPEGRGIGWINGNANRFEDSMANALYISDIAGGYDIDCVYNATHGTYNDLKESLYGLNYTATEPVRELHKIWDNFCEKNEQSAEYLQFAHSQGVMHVRNSLLDYPEEKRQRINVIGIAPAAYVYKESCNKVVHIRTPWYRDFVPKFDRNGAQRSTDLTTRLQSHPEANWHDHSFMSPTYQREIESHIKYYLEHGTIR
ncbi:MAG: RHS repeat-associated core domain-containing protein [Parachlamydiaceae bacterium]|nr:RHS repeat-associated core domain-containing protein [Parachlamydiaceae bacterium]